MAFRDQPEVVLIAGAAGSGKSILGEALARAGSAVLLDLDTLTNPLLEALADANVFGDRHWNDPLLRSIVRPARYAALRNAISAQSGRVVAVAPWSAELAGGTEWAALSAALGGSPHVIWLRADPQLLASRRARRALDRDAHVVDAAAAPVVPHLELDATLPTSDQVAELRGALNW